MIRRTAGDDWLLITQRDHARLAGELASHLGNQLFDRPGDCECFVQAVEVHDDGWVDIDGNPPLNEHGEPLDFAEAPLPLALTAWGASAERAVAKHPLVGLLVSLHSLSLSVDRSANETSAVSDAMGRFEMNKFQHRQVELQELCRKRLELSSDQPLHHGMAENSSDPREQSIVHQFRLLQAMDHLSLSLCTTRSIGMQTKPVVARPGGRPITFRLRRASSTSTAVKPWPMGVSEIQCSVTAKRIAASPFSENAQLALSMAAAAAESVHFTVNASR